MTINLAAKTRLLLGKEVDQLREAGKIPAVLYGHGVKNVNLEVSYKEFEKIFNEAGESTIIDLSINSKDPVKVLIADVQYEPVKDKLSHIDFHQIRMDEKINATVLLKFLGESKAVREEGGVLLHPISELEVRCLPKDLIHEIEVDVSSLDDFDKAIVLEDLKLPNSIEIVGHELEEVVAKVARPRAEEEEVKVEEQPPIEGEAAAGKEGEEVTEAKEVETPIEGKRKDKK